MASPYYASTASRKHPHNVQPLHWVENISLVQNQPYFYHVTCQLSTIISSGSVITNKPLTTERDGSSFSESERMFVPVYTSLERGLQVVNEWILSGHTNARLWCLSTEGLVQIGRPRYRAFVIPEKFFANEAWPNGVVFYTPRSRHGVPLNLDVVEQENWLVTRVFDRRSEKYENPC